MMTSTAQEVISFAQENDVKFIRLSFCDMSGKIKNIAIMAHRLPEALESGVPFDGSAIAGFGGKECSGLVLLPDPATLAVLPWRPGSGRVMRLFCDILNSDKSAFALDSRALLKRTVSRAEKMGYACKAGAECEFTIFKTDEDGNPTDEPFDSGGYLDVAPLDRCEDIRREICLALEEMGVIPESSHHERGPGQNEINFSLEDALACADNLLTFKTVAKAIAARNGLYASFMPKPFPDAAGNGLHINLLLTQNGKSIFKPADEGHCAEAESFIAGILSKSPEITLFLNPVKNSYARLETIEELRYAAWSRHRRSQFITIPAAQGEKVCAQLRSPDGAVNPYLALALIISAGLDGIENKLPLPEPVNGGAHASGAVENINLIALPESLEKAVFLAQGSSFAKNVLGEEFHAKYLSQMQ